MAEATLHPPCPGRTEAVRLFVSEAPLNIVMVDHDARVVAASPSFLDNVRQPIERMAGASLSAVIPGIDEGMVDARETLLNGAPAHTTTRSVELADGRVQWFRSDASVWRDDAGAIGGYLFINQDVTAEHEAEAGRREMEDLLQAVVDNIPATLSVQDLETEEYVLLNSRVRDVLGLSGDAAARAVSKALSLRQRLLVAEQREEVEESSGVTTTEITVGEGQATGRTLRLKRVIFNDLRGRRRMLSVGEDVTDLRETTRALEVALSQAELANQAKTAFLATMSHEIRTPLNGVIGMVQAMARDPLPKAQRRRLEVVRQSGEALLAIVNDALDIAKIEAGKLDLEEIEFDLAEVVEGAAAGFTALAGSKGLELSVDMSAAAGAYRGDPTRLRQVIANLISNAVKFTAQGSVRITATPAPAGFELCVVDTGPGIAPDVLGRLFEKFVQANASTARHYGGTGLGLSICRDLVELMGGSVRAESEPGQGARFTVSLPLVRVGEAGVRRLAEPEIRDVAQGLRILAADDNPINREVLKAIFEQVGLAVAVVGDGGAVLEAYEAQAWDVILMDVHMPVLDGPAATRRIREIERRTRRARTPIVALTADAMEHQRLEFLAGGMDAVVPKPLQIGELFATIEAVVGRPAGEDDATAAAGG